MYTEQSTTPLALDDFREKGSAWKTKTLQSKSEEKSWTSTSLGGYGWVVDVRNKAYPIQGKAKEERDMRAMLIKLKSILFHFETSKGTFCQYFNVFV